MLSKMHQWGRSLKRFFDAFLVIGGVLLLAGVLLYALATIPKVSWLHDAGTALLVAGLSLIISTASGKEAVRQQHAKDANLERKDKIYGPLYIELKQLWERLVEAGDGRASYPHWIEGVGEEPGRTQRYFQVPTFSVWPDLKSDYRIDNFTESACRLLNDVQRLAATYNSAVAETLTPNLDVLRPHLASAMEMVMRGPAYQEWLQQSKAGTRVRGPDDGWYERISWAHDASPPFQEEAKMWLDVVGALGWLLAREPDEAASTVQEAYRYISIVHPSVTWFREVFQLAWPEVSALAVNQQARAAAFSLLERVSPRVAQRDSAYQCIFDERIPCAVEVALVCSGWLLGLLQQREITLKTRKKAYNE